MRIEFSHKTELEKTINTTFSLLSPPRVAHFSLFRAQLNGSVYALHSPNSHQKNTWPSSIQSALPTEGAGYSVAVFLAPRRTRVARTPPAGPDRLSNAQMHLACSHVRQRLAECTSITQAVCGLSNSYEQEERPPFSAGSSAKSFTLLSALLGPVELARRFCIY